MIPATWKSSDLRCSRCGVPIVWHLRVDAKGVCSYRPDRLDQARAVRAVADRNVHADVEQE